MKRKVERRTFGRENEAQQERDRKWGKLEDVKILFDRVHMEVWPSRLMSVFDTIVAGYGKMVVFTEERVSSLGGD